MFRLVAITAALLAAGPNQELELARELIGRARFNDALEHLRAAERTAGSDAERAAVALLSARCHVAAGHREEAEEAFATALRLAPDASLEEDASPKLADAFERAKRRVYPADFVRLDVAAVAGRRLTLRLLDPWRQVRAVELHSPERPAKARCEPVASTCAFELTASAWWAEAVDAAGLPLAHLGTAAAPRLLTTAELPPPTPAQRPRWLGWTAAGVAVAAAVAAGYLYADSRSLAQQAGDQEWVGTSRELYGRALTEQRVSFGLALGAGAAAAVAVVGFRL